LIPEKREAADPASDMAFALRAGQIGTEAGRKMQRTRTKEQEKQKRKDQNQQKDNIGMK
jgi:hypothetical protein